MRVWVAGLTIGGAVNKAQNSTVSAFLYAVSGTSDLLVVPSQYFYLIFMNSPAFFNTGRTAIYTTTTTMVPTIALTRVAPAAQVAMIFAAEDSTPRT